MSELNTGDSVPLYALDKKTGVVTMPNGKKFNPYTNEGCENLTMDELKVYSQERPPTLNIKHTDLDALAEQALADDMALKEVTAKAKASKDKFKKALDEQGLLNPDFKGTDLVRVIVKAPMVFDPKKALAILTPAEIAKYSAISGALVKANLSPNDYAVLQSPGSISVTLQVAD